MTRAVHVHVHFNVDVHVDVDVNVDVNVDVDVNGCFSPGCGNAARPNPTRTSTYTPRGANF